MAEEKLLVKRDGEFCYPIYFENDFSFLPQALSDEGLAGKNMCIVSDSTVAPLYADQVKTELLKVTDQVCQPPIRPKTTFTFSFISLSSPVII